MKGPETILALVALVLFIAALAILFGTWTWLGLVKAVLLMFLSAFILFVAALSAGEDEGKTK